MSDFALAVRYELQWLPRKFFPDGSDELRVTMMHDSVLMVSVVHHLPSGINSRARVYVRMDELPRPAEAAVRMAAYLAITRLAGKELITRETGESAVGVTASEVAKAQQFGQKLLRGDYDA